MEYSLVGILAIVVHLIVNIDVFFFGKKKFSGRKFYILFLLSVILYHITDGFWGLLYENHLREAVWIDTMVYFIAMAISILFWGMFVYRYLETKNNKAFSYIGVALFVLQIVLIGLNTISFFNPNFPAILFKVTSDCVYSATTGRYVMLSIQVVMFLILAIYTFSSTRTAESSYKRRFLSIGIFSLFMIVAITLQVLFPLMPMYSLGFLVGVTALHTFVVEDEIANQRHELEEARSAVQTDPLTGVMSKHAYIDYEAQIDSQIDDGKISEFAVIVFDLNDLKGINDTFGHEVGDEYIVKSCQIISEVYKNIPIYRVGGDEFTIILTGDEYHDKDALFEEFNNRINANLKKRNPIVIAAGMSSFVPGKDTTILQVFTRADSEMYKRKHHIKAHHSHHLEA